MTFKPNHCSRIFRKKKKKVINGNMSSLYFYLGRIFSFGVCVCACVYNSSIHDTNAAMIVTHERFKDRINLTVQQ